MHGNILAQKLVHFSISAYRDYTKLNQREFLEEANQIDLRAENVDDVDLFKSIGNLIIKGVPGRTIDLMPKKHKSRSKAYFISNTDTWGSIRLLPYFNKENVFHTTNDRHLKRHYNRPLSEVQTTNTERTITLTDEFLSIRVNRFIKIRRLNSRYFKKSAIISGLKINLKTGNIVAYNSNGRKNNKISKIRQNSFQHISETLNSIYNVHPSHNKLDRNGGNMDKFFAKEFDDDVFLSTLYHTLCTLLQVSDYSDKIGKKITPELINDMLVTLFVKLKKIKAPNNYISYITRWYPTQKYLKRNDNKLVAAILDRLNLKTKSFIKLLHDNPDININNLITLSKLFGYNELNKYVANLDKRYYTTTKGFAPSTHYNPYDTLNKHFQYSLTGGEKSRLVKLLNSVFDGFDNKNPTHVIEEQLRQIMDHIIMINKIREYIPTIELRSQHIKDFHHEHIEYSKIERTIQKGYSIEYTFDKRLIKYIEQPIIGHVNDNEIVIATAYYPVLLKNDGEYSEEGSHMHHCVASYADREHSIIVSIREGSTEGRERVTCEFNLQKDLVQAKYFCNAQPPERFKEIVDKLTHKIQSYSGSIKSTGKEKIPLVINGFEIPIIEKKSMFDFLMGQINEF